jgi:hypothetical protein
MPKDSYRNFDEDPIVEALVPDPSRVPMLQLVRGFQARAVDDELLRIYLVADLSRYVEVARKHVRLVRPIPGGEGSNIWVDHEAPMVQTDRRATRAGAEYLCGPVTEKPPCPPPTSTCAPTWTTSKPTTWGGYSEAEGSSEPTGCAICKTR